MSKEATFKEQLLHLQDTILGHNSLNLQLVENASISVNNGQVGVHTGKKNFENAGELWLRSGVNRETVKTLVDSNSRWQFHQSLHELVSKLKYGTITEFFDYISGVYQQLEGVVQPTLDTTARFPSGFNGHTPETHQDGLKERFLKNLPDLNLSELEIKIILFVIKYHDEGCSLGRASHSLNTLGILYLSYGEEIFHIPELQPALKAIMYHDEPVIMPVLDDLIEDAKMLGKGLDESRQVEILLELIREFGSIELFMLLLLDKSDDRRERVGNTRLNKLSTNDLWQDLYFLTNIGWKIDHFGLVHESNDVKSSNTFRLKFDFDLSPDNKIATPENSNLVLTPKDPNRPPEIRMPEAVHGTFKAMSKEKGYFYLISDIYLHLHAQRIILVVLSAFEVYPGIEQVEIVFSDPKSYEAKVGSSKKRQPRSNEDIVLSFSRDTLLSSIDTFRIAAESKTPATKIADSLNAVEQGRILIPVTGKHA